MKITVDRINNSQGELVFTITVKEPHNAPFGDVEKDLMIELDKCFKSTTETNAGNIKIKDFILSSIHNAKEKTFIHVIENLKFGIKNELQPMFNPMCQEIYNWIYDAQEGHLKQWLQEFDPQRTKYYFSNDKTSESDFSYEYEEEE